MRHCFAHFASAFARTKKRRTPSPCEASFVSASVLHNLHEGKEEKNSEKHALCSEQSHSQNQIPVLAGVVVVLGVVHIVAAGVERSLASHTCERERENEEGKKKTSLDLSRDVGCTATRPKANSMLNQFYLFCSLPRV